MIERPEPSSIRMNVLSWNMLLDTTRTNNKRIRPQRDRLPGFIHALRQFDGSLNYVGVQEVATENGHHNGVALARALGFDTSFFTQHNLPLKNEPGIGRRNESLGSFGSVVDNAEPFAISHNRKALLTTVGSLAILNTHFRARAKYADVRIENAKKTVQIVEAYDNALITVDTNERIGKPARTILEDAGFRSVFTILDRPAPATFPAQAYKKEMYRLPFAAVLPAIAIDDILVRGDGIRVVDAGTIDVPSVAMKPVHNAAGSVVTVPEGPSDHMGLWATLDVASTICGIIKP